MIEQESGAGLQSLADTGIQLLADTGLQSLVGEAFEKALQLRRDHEAMEHLRKLNVVLEPVFRGDTVHWLATTDDGDRLVAEVEDPDPADAILRAWRASKHGAAAIDSSPGG